MRPVVICAAWAAAVVLVLLLTQCATSPPPDKLMEEPDAIFVAKCAGCHDLNRILTATKDEAAWRQTIALMSRKPGSTIKQDEVENLVALHTKRQKKEQELFNKDCTDCHPPRALAKTKTPAEWRETVKRMLAKKSGLVDESDIEYLVNYHIREQRLRFGGGGKSVQTRGAQQDDELVGQCCNCHDLERALNAEKDQAAWRRTIQDMSRKKGSHIQEADIEPLVQFHIRKNEKEAELFRKDCTRCHPESRSLEKIKTKDEWRQTIKRMTAKANNRVSDCHADLLINYHIRNQKKMDAYFSSKCTDCHTIDLALSASGDRGALEKTITTMLNRTGREPSYEEVQKLVQIHLERQKADQALFERDCNLCHSGNIALEKKKTPEEWRETVRRMQQKAPGTISNDEIDLLVAYHMRKSREK